MKKLFTTLISCVPMLILMSPFALAQTPDGQTPAEETVCDPLRADGVSKGLYGLCVAFCEAQDFASVDVPITEADFEMLEDKAPSGRILANYNKKKQVTDPDMPCILVEEPCPCWSSAELESIDGFFPPTEFGFTFCGGGIDPATGLFDIRSVAEALRAQQSALAIDLHRTSTPFELCNYFNGTVSPIIQRTFSVPAGTLTHEQSATCLTQVIARCDALGH